MSGWGVAWLVNKNAANISIIFDIFLEKATHLLNAFQ